MTYTSADIHAWAQEDFEKAVKNGVSLNPFSTSGGRNLWQKGWDGDRPSSLTDGSVNWRFWERGRLARIIASGEESLI